MREEKEKNKREGNMTALDEQEVQDCPSVRQWDNDITFAAEVRF